MEILWGFIIKFGGAPMEGTWGTVAASALRGDGIAPRFGDWTDM
jgi:hypothetical protein